MIEKTSNKEELIKIEASVDMNWEIPQIIASCGADPKKAYILNNKLVCPDVTQDKLDEAIESYNDIEAKIIAEDKRILSELSQSKIIELITSINFDQENRLRVLEGAVVLTKDQYTDILKTEYRKL